jgi:hypothetical protein
MKTYQVLAGMTLALGLVVGSALAADVLKSGPQTDSKIPGPFHPLNVTGEAAGKANCLVCQNGDHPVAMIFAREVSPSLTTLIKKVDDATGKNSKCEMGSFVVFCSDSKDLEAQLKTMAEKEKVKNCILAIDNPAGPDKYEVAKDADITVVLYTNRTVKANYAFKKGELKDKDIEKIVGDINKILPISK